MQGLFCCNSSSVFLLYQIPALIFLEPAFGLLFFSPPLTLPCGRMILPQRLLPLPTFCCSDCLSRSFQQVLGKEPTFTFPVALKAFSLQLQLFWCVWGTGKLRFLTMHYSAGQVQALPWICTKGCTQLGEPETSTTSPEPRVPLLLTTTYRWTWPARRTRWTFEVQTLWFPNLLCQITLLPTAHPSLWIQLY